MSECIVRFLQFLLISFKWMKSDHDRKSKKDDDDEFVNKNFYAYSLAASAFLSKLFYRFFYHFYWWVFRISCYPFMLIHIQNVAIQFLLLILLLEKLKDWRDEEERKKEKNTWILFSRNRNVQLPISIAEIQRPNVSYVVIFVYIENLHSILDFTVQFKTIESFFDYIIF